MAKTASDGGVIEKGKQNAYPFYAPRFWHGMRVVPYLQLMSRNRFRVHPLRVPLAIGVAFCTPINSVLGFAQNLIYGRRIEAVTFEQPPIFIVGHWRSGTTHLHELMSQDDRFTCPTTYECFAPDHFLLTGWIMPKLLYFLLPAKRPMDDMRLGFERPQEDEFALCAMGAPTPMFRTAFPNAPPPYLELLDMEGIPPDELADWKAKFLHFIKAVALNRPSKRLVLKSPPHTGRIQILSEMFAGARFIHLTRDPYELFPSTIRLWETLDAAQGFQLPRHEHLEDFVFDTCERMYRGFEKQRLTIPENQICSVRYKDLICEPLRELTRIYNHLDLGPIELIRDRVTQYLGTQREYRPSKYKLDPALKEKIRDRWSFYFENYGYA